MDLEGTNGLWAPFEEISLPHIPMDLEGANGLPFGSSLWDFLPPEYKKKSCTKNKNWKPKNK